MKGTIGNRTPPTMLAGGRWRRSRKDVNRALDLAALLNEQEAVACIRGLVRWRNRAERCLSFAAAVRAARGVAPAGGTPSVLDALSALVKSEVRTEDERSAGRAAAKRR